MHNRRHVALHPHDLGRPNNACVPHVFRPRDLKTLNFTWQMVADEHRLADLFRESAASQLAVIEKDKLSQTEEPLFTSQGEAVGETKVNIQVGYTVGLLHGSLLIDNRIERLPEELRVGLFATPAEYPATVRLNVSDHGACRTSVRVRVPSSFEVLDQPQLSGESGEAMVDLLCAEGLKMFMFDSVVNVGQTLQLALHPTVCLFLSRFTALMRFLTTAERVAIKPISNSTGIFGKSYYGGLPFKLGPTAFKFGLVPHQVHPLTNETCPSGQLGVRLKGAEHDAAQKYKASAKQFLAERAAEAASADEPTNLQKGEATAHGGTIEWDLVVQLYAHTSQSIVDGTSEWDEQHSPYFSVGTLRLPAQELDESYEEGNFGGWNPWHQLKAHRPLGPLNRARRVLYEAHREGRRCPFIFGV